MASSSLVSTLRRKAVAQPQQEIERCFFCGKELATEHHHLVDLNVMRFMCTCDMCLITEAENGMYKPLPQRILKLEDFKMSDGLWSDFLIPVNMAFFVNSSKRNGVAAYYPAPTGATESKLNMEPWNDLIKLNPVLKTLMPNLEALLINRLDDEAEYYIVPVDACYKLIGMIRVTWKGIFGGREVNDVIRKFFTELKQRSESCPI